MAVFLKAYQGYFGETTAVAYRPWVIFRYAITDIFKSRLFAAFFTLAFVPSIILLCIIYLRYNLQILDSLSLPLEEIIVIDAEFFATYMQAPQLYITFLIIMVLGPALISPDLRNNALPLYFSRPISKSKYILGKLLVLFALCSLVSWVPGMLLVLFKAYLEEPGWLAAHVNVLAGAFVAPVVWILSLSMVSLAISSVLKWKAIARVVFFVIFNLASGLRFVVGELFGGWYGGMVDVFEAMGNLVYWLYGIRIDFLHTEMPVAASLMTFVIITALATLILYRKIKAYEVVA